MSSVPSARHPARPRRILLLLGCVAICAITLATFGRGEIFGELAMFDDERRSATGETLDEVHAVAVLGADMRRLMALEAENAALKERWSGRKPACRK